VRAFAFVAVLSVLLCSLTLHACAAYPGLYRGLDTKVVQTVLAAAILFTTKETVTGATRRALARLAAGRRAKAA
jgi:hypothetical protein